MRMVDRGYIQRKISVFVVLVLYSYLIANIAASQLVPQVFAEIVSNNQQAAIGFLRSIRTLPDYSDFQDRLAGIYGIEFVRTLNADLVARNSEIRRLEALSAQYPQSPQLLHRLAVLYNENGSYEQSARYRAEALLLDPQIFD